MTEVGDLEVVFDSRRFNAFGCCPVLAVRGVPGVCPGGLGALLFLWAVLDIMAGNSVSVEEMASIMEPIIRKLKATVTSGPLSSISIQILVLDGDFGFGFEDQGNWTEQDLNAKVVHEREGKRPLVTGELDITLRDGIGIISDISFTDNSSWIKCQKFRLGARVVQSIGGQVRIKEAISEAFVLTSAFSQSKKTDRLHVHLANPPSLDDEVWRLEKIRQDGKSRQRLASHQIDTVKDFMRKYVTDPTKPREMLDCPKGAWDTIVEHASTCDVNDEIFFTFSVDGISLLFNSVHKLVAATFDGQNYQSVDDPTFSHKPLVKSIKEQAYSNLSSFVPVDGPAIFGPSKSLPTLQAEPISSSTIGVQHPDEFSVAHQAWCRIQAATMCSSVQLDLAARRNDVQQTSKIEKSKDTKQPKKIRNYVRLRKRI
ncbi:hypothetical protein Q3G72_028464 [Acer saccharum]|nr:hypothetical protein Q3G72_028464 [Acer saccharum]